jgi:hypothetical protein
MWKSVVLGGMVAFAATTGALAQDARDGSYHKLAFRSRDVAAERQALCDHATSLVARAGLSNNYALSQSQLFSLLLVMSLKSHGTQQHS